MFKRKDDIRTLVVVIVVCVIFLILILFINKKSNFQKLASVEEYNNFFTNVGYINNYLNAIAVQDNVAVYNVLDEKYIQNNGITYDNVLEKIDTYSIDSTVNVKKMDFVQVGNNFMYYVFGEIYENTYYSEKKVDDDFEVVISIDFDSASYSLYPVESNNYKKVINSKKVIKIARNSSNALTASDFIDKEQVCSIYLSDFYNKLWRDIDATYDLLSDSMKKKYSTVDSYHNYVTANIAKTSTIANKCKVDEVDDKRVYSVIDEKGNYYKFMEDAVLNYKVDFSFNNDNEE